MTPHRLDLAGDRSRARVIDYKTGKLKANMAEVVLNGGSELQRCLYALAVKTLLADDVRIDAALLYPFANGQEALFPLPNVDAALAELTQAIALAKCNLEAGLPLPGIDAASSFNEFAFALPANAGYLAANAGYLARKMPLAREKLGEATKIWEAQ